MPTPPDVPRRHIPSDLDDVMMRLVRSLARQAARENHERETGQPFDQPPDQDREKRTNRKHRG